MSDVGVVDVSEVSIVAFLSDDLHCADHLILIHEGVEAELRELLGEVVGRNVHEGIVWGFFLCGLRRERKIAHNELASLLLHVLVEDDFVHALCKVEVYLGKKGRGV
jgi:hypothetical protein